MCGMIASIGLGVMGAVFQGMGQSQQIDEQNNVAAHNRQVAAMARNTEEQYNQYNYIREQRKIRTQGWDIVTRGRQERAKAIASAASSNIQGASIDAVVADVQGITAREVYRNDAAKDDALVDVIAKGKQAEATHLQRFWSNQPKGKGGVYAGMLMGVANAFAGGLTG